LTAALVRSRRWWVALAAGTIGLALVGGGAAAWLHGRATIGPSPAAPVPTAADEPLLTEQRKKEQFLREAVEQYARPDRDHLNVGRLTHVELALFYLQNNRLEDADQFFASLLDNHGKIMTYRTLGR